MSVYRHFLKCSGYVIRVDIEKRSGLYYYSLNWSTEPDSFIAKNLDLNYVDDINFALRDIGNSSRNILRGLPLYESEIKSKVRGMLDHIRSNIELSEIDPKKKIIDNGYSFVEDFLTKELPESIGGLKLSDIRHYEDSKNRMLRWVVCWGESDDLLFIEISIMKMDLMFTGMLESKIRSAFQDKVALLKMQNPGEFEVECIDSTGVETNFDEGLTYMAETHEDDSLLFVWDRYGKRGEFALFRFEKLKQE